MAQQKSVSVSSDRYDTLRMDNQAYVNMPEQEDYLSPVSPEGTLNTMESSTPPLPRKSSGSGSLTEVKTEGDEFKPPPPATPVPSKPPPPKRNESLASNVSRNSSLNKPKGSTKYPKMGNGFASLERNSEKEKVILRQKNSAFDSGVGDLEHVHIDGMNQNKNYDYADYGHQYEELPSRKGTGKHLPMDSGVDSRSEFYQSSGGTSDLVSEADDTATIVNNRSEKRKRVNPLYDAMTQSVPSIYNKTKPPVDEHMRRQVRCLTCSVIVLSLLCCAAVAVAIYAVIYQNNTKDDRDPVLMSEVRKLSQDYTKMEDLLNSFGDNNDTLQILSDLIKKVNLLEQNSEAQMEVLKGQIASANRDILTNSQVISDTHTNISSVISYLNMTLQLQLHQISKMEGPMGPQGVANFSKCSYYNMSKETVASDTFPSLTMWLPTEIDLENNIALFAACTVDGGTREELEFHAMNPQKVQYRCKCSGFVSGENRRTCYIHILSCPRYS